ncbi:MAG: hypothetical protein DRN71_01810 [Candidatus Nanohalarchaeota archaeon]|nr:MAG: hypothetical protein DRN71_01810 [Candidatus Nanohaloarchaeota archaeon]
MDLAQLISGMFGEIDPVVIMLLVAALPFGECRASILYGVMKGIDPFLVFFGSIFANILVVPIIFFFLDRASFMKLVNLILGKRITKKINKNREKFEVYEELALFGFVAVPMVGAGAWTGALLVAVLGLDKKKSFLIIAAGVVTAAVIVSAFAYGANGVFAHVAG